MGDAGYLSKDWHKKFLDIGIFLFTGVRMNIKKIITRSQHELLKMRQTIETVLSVLISRFHIARFLSRSVMGHLTNNVYGLMAYCINNVYKFDLYYLIINANIQLD